MPAIIGAIAKTVGKQILKKAASETAGLVTGKPRGSGGGSSKWIAAGLVILVVLVGAVVAVVASLVSTFAGVGAAAAYQCQPGTAGGMEPVTNGKGLADIPAVALDTYIKAAQKTGLDWAVLAGIGGTESNHGRHGGATLAANGDVRPKVIGIALGFGDSDNGKWDGDTSDDRAVGPMQFIPTTWKSMGQDGNGDGVKDPHNMYDAILAAAHYLKVSGAPGNYRKALWSYNHSDVYYSKVMAKADTYRKAAAQANLDPAASAAPDSTGTNVPAAGTATGGTATTKWIMPLQEGVYTISSGFGYRVHPITGVRKLHNGLDFAAPAGTPIMAIGDGTVVRNYFQPGGYGNAVFIDHGNGIVTHYGHMLEKSPLTVGQKVTASTLVGKVGSTGGSTGNHLHLTVMQNGTGIDPAKFLADAGNAVPGDAVSGDTGTSSNCNDPAAGGNYPPSTGDGAWGGYQNGRIPTPALCPIAFAPNQRLRCDAAKAVEAMNVAYKAAFGHNMVITDSYRDYAGQVDCRRRKGNVCAVPGTSNHGWALALDLGDGINNFGSATHKWMQANAGKFGWLHPGWAQAGGSKPEPWHWQFGVTN